ncbi:hypothetical protein D3C75_1030270 [compost metagenome]
MLLAYPAHHGPQGVQVTHVEGLQQHLGTQGAALFGHFGQAVLAPALQDQRHPRGGVGRRQRATDTACGAGDEDAAG